MTLREKIEFMQHDGTLVDACERLAKSCRESWAECHPFVRSAMEAFDPSPLDRARSTLKAAGYVDIGPPVSLDGDIIIWRSGTTPNEVWRLPESST